MADDHTLLRSISQANPRGAGQGDLPALLRRFADTVEALGTVEVEDLVMHDEITEDGSWLSFTLYYSKPRLAAVPND
ncbi:hypothetical protein LB823_15545 [Tsukamurella sp. M9C]|uniref:hypothetical protein n=1 Tax=unclassified Tsukamurella TaxID=2633480 RepID=UPI001CCD1961|nr:hypothetical protein [Tsukamurella sp. M9C]MCA0157606.1 hypothetical protein [Tsukamurella sp. M9C]